MSPPPLTSRFFIFPKCAENTLLRFYKGRESESDIRFDLAVI